MFPRSRLLFTGPPGCGKTSAAAAIAYELGLSAFRVHFPGLLGNGYMGTAANNIRNALGPVMRTGHVVVFDEIDAIGSARTEGRTGADREYNVVVSTLLTELDSVGSHGIFIATTNRSELLDPALRRRFEDEFEFASPSDGAKSLLAVKLWNAFDLPPLLCPRTNGEVSFDAVAKMVTKAARRIVLAEATGAA
jgi:AAA+ superfamily predicted ATPase